MYIAQCTLTVYIYLTCSHGCYVSRKEIRIHCACVHVCGVRVVVEGGGGEPKLSSIVSIFAHNMPC